MKKRSLEIKENGQIIKHIVKDEKIPSIKQQLLIKQMVQKKCTRLSL